MQGLRRTYGIAEPVRREMELKDVSTGDAMGASFLRGKSVSVGEDILGGKDNEMGGWEGVFGTGEFLISQDPGQPGYGELGARK